MHLSRSDTPDGLKKAIEGRIQALANVYGLFEESHRSGPDLRTLVTQELSPYCPDGERRVQIGGQDMLLEPGVKKRGMIRK